MSTTFVDPPGFSRPIEALRAIQALLGSRTGLAVGKWFTPASRAVLTEDENP
jgi:hypothetical protein